MTYREVEYLADSVELKILIEKYPIKLGLYKNEKIFLISNCLIIEIYGFVVEDFFYFDIYDIDLNFYSNIDRLLYSFDFNKIQSVFQKEKSTRKQVLITHLQISQAQTNLEFTLNAEVYFFTMLQLMDELLSDIMTCKKEIRKEHWSPIFEPKKNQLKVILEKL